MKKLLISLMLFLILSGVYSQSGNDNLRLEYTFPGYVFYEGEEKRTLTEIERLLNVNEVEHFKFRKARIQYEVSILCGISSTLLIGYGFILQRTFGSKIKWEYAGTGIGLGLLSYALSNRFNNVARRCIKRYNQNLGEYYYK